MTPTIHRYKGFVGLQIFIGPGTGEMTFEAMNTGERRVIKVPAALDIFAYFKDAERAIRSPYEVFYFMSRNDVTFLISGMNPEVNEDF